MIKRIIFIAVMCAFVAVPALADMVGNTIYYQTGGSLYNTTVGVWTQNFVGNFPIGDMTDIAFDTDGQLYGVAFNSSGSFWSINADTAAATRLATSFNAGTQDIGYGVNALSNYAAGKFYAAVDSGGQDEGHFYDWTWNGVSLTGTDVGRYYDAGAESGFGGATLFASAGDIWTANDGAVYATINAGLTGTGYLVTVDPSTAEVDWLATLGPNTYYGLAESDATGTQLLYILNSDGRVRTWDGSNLSGFLSGVDIGDGINGSTAVPVPAAVLLGLLGLGVAGVKLRKFA